MSGLAKNNAKNRLLLHRDPDRQLVVSLERLVRDFPPGSLLPGGGLFHGPMSIALLFFALEKHYEGMKIDNMSLKAWYSAYMGNIHQIIGQLSHIRPDNCGILENYLSYLALSAAINRHGGSAQRLCSWLPALTRPNANNGWPTGRAGYLYLLRLAKTSFAHDPKILTLLDNTAAKVIDCILASPHPWNHRGIVYPGAAYGVIGIITQIVLTNPTYAAKIEHHLDFLLHNQYESGNWPITLPNGPDHFVEFSHGAPGIVSSLLSIKKHFPNLADRIDAAIEKGRKVIREKGLLLKLEPCLWSGIAGNALALDEEGFEYFLEYMTECAMEARQETGLMSRSQQPASLWTGAAGRVWVWAHKSVGEGVEKRILGYNDI